MHETTRHGIGIASTIRNGEIVMSKNIKAVATRDYDAAVDAASKYVEGMRVGNARLIGEAFHRDAVMYGFNDGDLVGGPIQNLYDFVEDKGEAPDMVVRLDVLAITPTTAVVRVDMEKDAIGRDYIDFLSLVKIDGVWQVIAKIFHQFEA
jgi:hypothetical protein